MFEAIKDIIQSVLGYVVSIPFIREFVRYIFRLIKLPRSIAIKIPVIGKFSFFINGRNYKYISSRYDGVGRIIYWRGFKDYESETMTIIKRTIANSDVCLDIGANIGIISMAACAFNPNVKVYAFEPVPYVFNALKTHISINSINGQVTCVQQVICDKEGEVPFHVPLKNTSSASLNTKGFHNLPGRIVLLQSNTIDAFVKAEGLTKVDLIKIDVEGYELSVLKGARKILSRDKPVIICECLHGSDTNSLEILLKQYGYIFFHLMSQGAIRRECIVPDINERYNNYLFITENECSGVHP